MSGYALITGASSGLGLALAWPRHSLVADCDREPAQAVQAGYLRGMDNGGRGLMSLAHLHREGTPLAPEIWRHTLPLTQEGDRPPHMVGVPGA